MKIAIGRKINFNPLLFLIFLTIGVRIIPALITPKVGDLPTYQIIGKAVLAGKNPYKITDSYPYPPLWMWVEALAALVSDKFSLPFQFIIKIPLIFSDALITFLIYKLTFSRSNRICFYSALLFALNPVAILITSVHGQFDTLPILMILLAIYYFNYSTFLRSAFFLGFGIALKSFPILLLPFFAINYKKSLREKIKFVILAVTPVFIVLSPFLLFSFEEVKRKLFQYSGVTDYGWIAIYRTFYWLKDNLAFQPISGTSTLLEQSKILFIVVYVLFLLAVMIKKRKMSLVTMAAITFCLFYLVYGGVASQYLFWVVPFLILINPKLALGYSFFSSLALMSFYISAGHKIISSYFPNFSFFFKHFLTLYFISLILLYLFLLWLAKKLLNFCFENKLTRNFVNFVNDFVINIFLRRKRVIISYNDSRSSVIDLIRKIKKDRTTSISYDEAYQILMAVKNTQKIKGDIAEVGVYKGGTAKLICEIKKGKTLHLFDTFEGLPEVKPIDVPFRKGDYAALVEEVEDYLKKYSGVFFYKGLFPQTANPIKNKTFSFVHLDVDLYESTFNSLKFFYPRMNKGGIIISHDYIGAKGVEKAFDEFFKNKPEPIIEMFGSQCLIVKI